MKKTNLYLALALSGTILFSGCYRQVNQQQVSCDNIEWEYDGNNGPDHWQDLCVDYSTCGGTVQSPINIENASEDLTLAGIPENYNLSGVHIVNKGHTIQVNVDNGSEIVINGEIYKLLQFHFHTHSEHAVGGIDRPLEVHFVHKNETTGKLVVIGVFVREGNANAFLDNFIPHLPVVKDAIYDDASTTFNVKDFMPADSSYYTYGGSLTTPPCSEIVTWFVMEHPVEASFEQIEALHHLEHDNARPTQPLNGRPLRHFHS